ncbi:hypothetical protein ACFVIM_31700 [Streptomyces sp. NPDC057638]
MPEGEPCSCEPSARKRGWDRVARTARAAKPLVELLAAAATLVVVVLGMR